MSKWAGCLTLILIAFVAGASAAVFVDDFNKDGWPDILVAHSDDPSDFKLLINQGGRDGRVMFMSMPVQMKGSETMRLPPRMPAPAPDMKQKQSIKLSKPGLKPVGGGWTLPPVEPVVPTPAAPPTTWQDDISVNRQDVEPPMFPRRAAVEEVQGPPQAALFNFKDENSGDQLRWLEKGIANILKFDVMEVKDVALIDRDRTEVVFDRKWYQNSGIQADMVITGTFQRVSNRLEVQTWVIDGRDGETMLAEFTVDGDPADIFQVIEKVGAQLKQKIREQTQTR